MFMIWTSAIASDHLDEWSTIDGKKRRLLSSLAASSHEASESLSRALFSRTSHNTKKGDYTEKQPKIALGVLGNGRVLPSGVLAERQAYLFIIQVEYHRTRNRIEQVPPEGYPDVYLFKLAPCWILDPVAKRT